MPTDVILSPELVEQVFRDCLFRDGEDTSNHVVAEGVRVKVGFHPQRLESHRQDVIGMLAELPKEFQAAGGGGYTFLSACLDRHHRLWTDLHQVVEMLLVLGLALDLVAYCNEDREMWADIFPGGMPYFVVK